MAEMTAEQFADWAERRAAAIERLDFTAALQKVLDDLIKGLVDCFDASHDPDGDPWKPLSLAYRRPLWGRRKQMIRRVVDEHRDAAVGGSWFWVQVDPTVAGLHNFALQKRPLREFLGFGDRQLDRAAGVVADEACKQLLEGL